MSLIIPSLLALGAIYVVFWATWFLLRRHLIQTTTVLADIPLLLHPPPPKHQRILGDAIIAGGRWVPRSPPDTLRTDPFHSLSGFLTARILTDYFTKVILIETDLRLDATRVGQRSQAHAYLSIGLEILRALFPGFDAEARSSGAL